MKKYTEYLEEIYQPLTADEIKKVGSVIQNPIEQKLYDEVIYLRRLMGEAYMWIGRKATQSQINKAYTSLMKEATRINKENREADL
jgi:cell division ATPase FtsA